MRTTLLPLVAGITLALSPGYSFSETRVQVNANANQFPYITVRLRVADSKTGKNVADLSQDKLLVSEDLSKVGIENFKILSSSDSKFILT